MVPAEQDKFFVAISEYLIPEDQILEYLADHRAWTKDAYDRGLMLFSGRQDPPVGGVLGFRAGSQAEAEAFIASDPFVRGGVSRYRIVGCTPTHYPWRNDEFDAFNQRALGEPLQAGAD